MIISQSPALAVQRSQRSFRCCLVTLRSCGVGTRPAVDRDPKTRLRNAIAPACCPSVPFKALVVCSMCHEQLSLSHRPSLQSLASVVVGEMLRQSETYPRWLVSSRLVLDRGMKNCLPATSWRMRSHCCPCSTSELTANFFWTAVVAVDRLPRSMMLQFLCASLRAHGSVRCHNNTHAYFVSGWEKEAERDDHFRTAPTENFGPTFKFCLPRSLVKLLSDSRHYFLLFSLYFRRLFQKSLCTLLWQITVFWRLSITNTNTLILGAEISHEVKTDLHLRRPEFLRLPASFRKPFQLTETRGFADHFLKISRSYSSGNLITAIFPVRSKVVSYDVLHDSLWYLVVCHSLFPESSSYLCIERKLNFSNFPRAEPIGQLWCLAPYI